MTLARLLKSLKQSSYFFFFNCCVVEIKYIIRERISLLYHDGRGWKCFSKIKKKQNIMLCSHRQFTVQFKSVSFVIV